MWIWPSWYIYIYKHIPKNPFLVWLFVSNGQFPHRLSLLPKILFFSPPTRFLGLIYALPVSSNSIYQYPPTLSNSILQLYLPVSSNSIHQYPPLHLPVYPATLSTIIIQLYQYPPNLPVYSNSIYHYHPILPASSNSTCQYQPFLPVSSNSI